MKREAYLKSRFTETLKAKCPDLISLQLATRGAPDRLIVGWFRSSFWEFKHGTPRFEAPDLQRLMCMRLERSGVPCHYVVWLEERNVKTTHIVAPKRIKAFQAGDHSVARDSWPDFDMRQLVAYVSDHHLVTQVDSY